MELNYKDSTHQVIIQSSTALTCGSTRFIALELAISVMNNSTPLSQVFLHPDPVIPNKWEHGIDLVDGRQWRQTIRHQAVGLNPGFYNTYTVPGEWLVAELSPRRDIQDILFGMIEQDGVTQIDCTFF